MAERLACQFLIERGYRHIQSNYRCRYGEIDLIMEDNDYLVFVEVRYRHSGRYGGAIASIDHRKQAKLRATAEHYLQRSRVASNRPCRFDVVLLGPSQTGFECIRNAF